MDKIMYVSLGLLILFAWFDSQNVIGIKQIDAGWKNSDALWSIFANIISPAAYWMWIWVLASMAITWYLYSKDKSEALAIFLIPTLLINFGTQDIIYYIISPDTLSGSVGCWADVLTPIRLISDVLKETCPTATSFIISAFVGVIISYYIYNWLKKQRW